MVWFTEAEAPEGMRLYAIGDVHGCLDRLEAVHAGIERDLAARPVEDWRIIHVGDYCDRGPDSRGTIEYLRQRVAADARMICLLGNHDHMFLESIQGNARWQSPWIGNGGVQTLESYGMSLRDFEWRLFGDESFDDIVPAEHMAFLNGLDLSARFGDYFFVHAGIDPDVALEEQDPETMIWIRGRFLNDGREHPAVIIHGHTPVERIDVRPNRIDIDTGAVFGRALTCLVLEDRSKARLMPDGPAPLL